MASEIPTEMKRLMVTSPGPSLSSCSVQIQTVPTPIPKSGQLLIRVIAAPVNPSDYGAWHSSKPDSYPLVMGKEGCGIVVASGGGITTWRCPVGTKVGFACNDSTQGSYSEYVVMDAISGVFPMPDDVPIEDCASFLVNPYTAVGILDTAEQAGCDTIVHTAAASQLGQMIVKLAHIKGMTVINVVRREDQKKILEEIGAKHIVVTSGDDDKWKAELKEKIKELGATCAFDAVSGDMTGHLLDCMPQRGIVYLYGNLAGRAGNINPADLIYRKKQLKSFYLTSWIKSGGTIQMARRMMAAGSIVNSGLKSPDAWCCTQFEDTTMEKAFDDIVKMLGGSVTGKKLRIRFDGGAKA